MENTNTILNNWINEFTPIIERLREIVKELIPYFIYIGIWTLGISLLWNAVKYIMWHLKKETTRTFDNETIQDTKDEKKQAFMKMLEEAWKEQEEYKNMYKDFEDYVYKHWKYDDWERPLSDEQFERRRQRKKMHPWYENFS